MVHVLVPRLSIDGEQLVDRFQRADGRGILLVEFDRIRMSNACCSVAEFGVALEL
jgi:hypothetical protein